MKLNLYHSRLSVVIIICLFIFNSANGQTDADAVMMTKNNFCVGAMYNYGSWKNYWEGTFKRNNANLGTVSTQMLGVMGNYGVSKKLNVLFGIPYVKTKATGGQLHGMKGIQDISLWLKYMPLEKTLGNGTFSVYTIAGVSLPVTEYTADFQPLSIGLHSKNLSLRAMVDYQLGDWFATASYTYVARSNVKIYRDAYYTTEMHYSNKVAMPDAAQYNLRLGYRNNSFIVEALLSNWTTLGGFDITKNNMPFPSNKMNITTAGINIKYNINAVAGLSLIGGYNMTLAGRNVGESNSFNTGVFYILDFSKHKNGVTSNNKKN